MLTIALFSRGAKRGSLEAGEVQNWTEKPDCMATVIR